MRQLLHELWTKPYGEYDDKNIRLLALITGVLVHIAVITAVWFIVRSYIPAYSEVPQQPNNFAGSSGGGGGNSKEIVVEFGPSPGDENAVDEDKINPERFKIIRIKIVNPRSEGTPVIAEEKQPKKIKKLKSVMGSSLAKNFPKRHVRGSGPGSGGGSGGGKGGGIGKGSGYSIDWGGTGTRRLVSGTIPLYPKGTDKEMAVTLQFTVMPDGSVAKVLPVTRGDELLEHAAITALETWRFDPLPPQNDQKLQFGKITFNFKLEHATVHPIND